jgi:predicted nucleotidyltransferase
LSCNITCREQGPYCGKEAAEPDKFVFTAWKTLWGSVGFINGVLKRYSLPTRIRVPAEWPAIRRSLAFVLENPAVRSILLTGSVITDAPRPLKDYDVVFWCHDLRAVIDQEAAIRATLPTHVDGVPVDYWFMAAKDVLDTFFVSLEPDTKRLYLTRWFTPNLIELEAGIEVISVPLGPFHKLLKAETVTAVRGLGDVIAKITTAIGIKPCRGCGERQEQLNQLVPLGNHVNTS